MDKILEKLNIARELVRSGGYKKDGTNTYSKYDYYTPEMVENIVADVTKKTGTICICNLMADQFGLYQQLELIDMESKEKLTFQLRTEKGELKATNATQQLGGTDTYSERYIKMKVFQIKDNNLDFDSKDHTIASKTPQKSKIGVSEAILDDDIGF